LVEGKTFRELMDEAPLSTEKMISLATKIAEGLSTAQAAVIVHRDLKPENPMREDLDTAQRYFYLALEKDPSYDPAYAGLARVWAARQQMSYTPPHEAGPKATAAALQAIALDDTSAEAHDALAAVRTWTDWDWAGAEPEWRRALELDPNAANTDAYFAHFLVITGRVDEAIPHSERPSSLTRSMHSTTSCTGTF
jgi:Tfp pilus assembly protein PilF